MQSKNLLPRTRDVRLNYSTAHTVDGLFEIRPVQRWQLIAAGESVESHPLRRRANRLNVSRR
jgi:hypothetical protein